MPPIELLRLEGHNVASTLRKQLEQLSRYLGLSTQFLNSTDLAKQDIGLDGQDRVIEICRAMKAGEYYNAIGGIPLYDASAFGKSEIILRFLQPRHQCYKQYENPFVPYLSVIDVLMFNRLEQARLMLQEFDLVEKPVVTNE